MIASAFKFSSFLSVNRRRTSQVEQYPTCVKAFSVSFLFLQKYTQENICSSDDYTGFPTKLFKSNFSCKTVFLLEGLGKSQDGFIPDIDVLNLMNMISWLTCISWLRATPFHKYYSGKTLQDLQLSEFTETCKSTGCLIT